MHSLFTCPLCGQPLTRGDHAYTCPSGHSYDIASSGYTHLLPANQKHSKNPGDDKAMVAARSAFLDRDYYRPLRDALAQAAAQLLKGLEAPCILDSGCGEGYYTTQLYQVLAEAGCSPRVAGIDISKFALKRAARRLPQGEFAVASVYRLPVADRSMDLLVNVFSPLAAEEFSRVIRPGGWFLYVVPSARHLWGMKEILYPRPYENPVKEEQYPGFVHWDTTVLRYSAAIRRPEDIMALFHMTPYAWKTPREGVDRLNQLEELTTDIGFDLHMYRRVD